MTRLALCLLLLATGATENVIADQTRLEITSLELFQLT